MDSSARWLVFALVLILAGLAPSPADEPALDDAVALRRIILEGSRSGKSPMIYVDLGGRSFRARLLTANASGITVRAMGSELSIDWKRLATHRLAGIATKFASRGADHIRIAQFLVQHQRADAAREAADRALGLDPSLRGRVKEILAPLAKTEAAARRSSVVKPGTAKAAREDSQFDAVWTHVARTSAVIYWRLNDISKAATSYVEYGETAEFGKKTTTTREPRWAQFHRIRGLEIGKTYHYRLVILDPKTGAKIVSGNRTLATKAQEGAILIPGGLGGPPYDLSRSNARYVLTQDITARGTAFTISGSNVTLDLDGHTVIFGDDTAEQVRGVWIKGSGKISVGNGHIVQGRRSKKYSAAVESRWRPGACEIFGISTDVHLPCAYPMKMLGRTGDAHIHHNHLYSRVTELDSRHWPGNDLLRIDGVSGNVRVHDNLLTEGCHVGMRVGGGKKGATGSADIHHNDIRHNQQYVNGYAFALSCAGANVHHNRVTSMGRSVHLTGPGIQFHDNWLDTRGHVQLDDMPQKSRPFKFRRVELHGIKFEGGGVKNCKVYGNFMRITQRLPKEFEPWRTHQELENLGPDAGGKIYVLSKATTVASGRLEDATRSWERDRWRGYRVKYRRDLPPVEITGNDATSLRGTFQAGPSGPYAIYMQWDWVPATPLNIACYDPNAMNEVYGNTFVALTEYKKTRHGGYGKSGQWASSIHFVGMTKGPAQEGKYAIYLHDNTFISNDLFLNTSYRKPNMSIRIEKNKFILARQPPPAGGHRAMRNVGRAIEQAVRSGGNTFEGMQP